MSANLLPGDLVVFTPTGRVFLVTSRGRSLIGAFEIGIRKETAITHVDFPYGWKERKVFR